MHIFLCTSHKICLFSHFIPKTRKKSELSFFSDTKITHQGKNAARMFVPLRKIWIAIKRLSIADFRITAFLITDKKIRSTPILSFSYNLFLTSYFLSVQFPYAICFLTPTRSIRLSLSRSASTGVRKPPVFFGPQKSKRQAFVSSHAP